MGSLGRLKTQPEMITVNITEARIADAGQPVRAT